MDQSRIAELLSPFLGPILRPPANSKLTSQQNFEDANQHPSEQNSCHFEPAPAVDEPAALSPALLQHISTYIDILIRWNARVNLTAICDPEQIVTRHFGESLFAARHLFPRDAHVGTAAIGDPAERRTGLTVADIGSGAGFPGLPLKLWAPQISLTLIESNHKKAAFLREVVRTLTLTDVDVTAARAETLVGHAFDLVTLRAVERFESVLPVAASLVASAGHLALLIGAGQEPQAARNLSFEWQESIPVPCSQARILLIGHSLGSR